MNTSREQLPIMAKYLFTFPNWQYKRLDHSVQPSAQCRISSLFLVQHVHTCVIQRMRGVAWYVVVHEIGHKRRLVGVLGAILWVFH